MAESSSDTESSCGWTIISNEGSDIETLGPEAAVEYGTDLLERPPLVEADESESISGCDVVKPDGSLSPVGAEQAVDETLNASEDKHSSMVKEHPGPLSSSDHSDIVTLGDMKESEHGEAEAEEGPAANEEFYLGRSCSSQYAFTAAETGLQSNHWKLPQGLVNLGYHLRHQLIGGHSFAGVFQGHMTAATTSSSSEDEVGGNTSTVVRRRRIKKNSTSVVTEPEDEEALESGPSEEEEDIEEEEKQLLLQTEVTPAVPEVQTQGSILNKCILLALVVAISMGFGHFYGTVQIQDRQKMVEKVRLNELDDVRDVLNPQIQRWESSLDDLDEQKVISLLTDAIGKIKKENEELYVKQQHIETQRDDLMMLLKQKAEERITILSRQQRLMAENQQLKTSLEHEESSLSTLQENLRQLHSKIEELEAMGAGADSLLSENQRLKDELEEEKDLIRSFKTQREDMKARTQSLRKKLDKEKKVTDEMRREISRLRSLIARNDATSEAEELQSRVSELEKRLNFEQQRSDLWQRLYVESKEERAKGDTESKLKKPREGMSGKVKETFDAVKNSTKEFVHHHKEQIKKAKEAVKENLRKFSDSVKSTFRHFKDSASTLINKARGFYVKECDERDLKCQRKFHKPHQKQWPGIHDSFQSNHNTRKPGEKVHKEQCQGTHRGGLKGCSGVLDCAYQESMSLFNQAMEPIRADEFHQLLQSYLQQEVDHFHHWKELEAFINNFFHNGVFIHDRMLFTDFVSSVEDYLADMQEYLGLDDGMFRDLDDFIYRHFFGEAYTKSSCPNGPFERPDGDAKEEPRAKHHQRKQQKARPRPYSERKWNKQGRTTDRHMADVKIELGPMPFDPKY